MSKSNESNNKVHPKVLKFGGSSLASPVHIARVAKTITRFVKSNQIPVVVVSAMGGETNRLLDLVQACSPHRSTTRESELAVADARSAVLSTGEQVTSGLVALALQRLGYKARPLSSWQLPIRTFSDEGSVNIRSIDTSRINQLINTRTIPVVTGFQGIEAGRLQVLERGGSDTTAVALAAALKTGRCEIFTDVEGVYDSDPRTNDAAVLYDELSLDEMHRLSHSGATVLAEQAVKVAKNHRISLHVRSSFVEKEGTMVRPNETYVQKFEFNQSKVEVTL